MMDYGFLIFGCVLLSSCVAFCIVILDDRFLAHKQARLWEAHVLASRMSGSDMPEHEENAMDTVPLPEESPISTNYFAESYVSFRRALNAHAACAGVVFSGEEATGLYSVYERWARKGESEAAQ